MYGIASVGWLYPFFKFPHKHLLSVSLTWVVRYSFIKTQKVFIIDSVLEQISKTFTHNYKNIYIYIYVCFILLDPFVIIWQINSFHFNNITILLRFITWIFITTFSKKNNNISIFVYNIFKHSIFWNCLCVNLRLKTIS